jgi:hypothetical protein
LLTRTLSLFLSWPRGLKRALVVGLDVALVAFTAWLALALRLETLTPKLLAWMTVFAVSASVALLLTLNRKIHRAHNRVREFNFSLAGLVGFDLHGKTIGIVGTGTITVADITIASKTVTMTITA